MNKAAVFFMLMGALAVSAYAQSSTNIYGRISVGYGSSNGGKVEGSPGRDGKFQQWGNGMTASRWGIKGSESLDNGVKVFFNLESGFNPESGKVSGSLFRRKALVGISAQFGTLQLGRQNNVVDNLLSPYTYLGNPGQACAVCNVAVSSSQRASRYNSGLVYISPEFANFTFQLGYVSKNDESGIGNMGDKHLFALGGTYVHDNFKISLAYETKPVSISDVRASWGLGAEYDFGTFKIDVGYMDNHYKSDGKGLYGEVSMPIGAFYIGAQAAYNYDARSPINDDKIKPFSLGLFTTYNLSKKTRLYALYSYIDSDAQKFANASRHNTYVFGLAHYF